MEGVLAKSIRFQYTINIAVLPADSISDTAFIFTMILDSSQGTELFWWVWNISHEETSLIEVTSLIEIVTRLEFLSIRVRKASSTEIILP